MIINKLCLAIMASFCVFFSPEPCYAREDGLKDIYSDRYIVFIGEIIKHKDLGYRLGPELDELAAFVGQDYIVTIDVKRHISGATNNKRYKLLITVLNIEHVKKYRIFFILDKSEKNRIVFWRQMEDIICLNEKFIDESGIAELALDQFNGNCLSL